MDLDLDVELIGPEKRHRGVGFVLSHDVASNRHALLDGIAPVFQAHLRPEPLVIPPGHIPDGINALGCPASRVAYDPVRELEPAVREPSCRRAGANGHNDDVRRQDLAILQEHPGDAAVSADKIRLEFSGSPPPAASSTAAFPVAPAPGEVSAAGGSFPVESLTEPGPNPIAQAAVTAAKHQIGTPYVWGAETPRVGFDCSGLVQWAYHKVNIALPRTAAAQATAGHQISLNQLQPGDLLFFYQPVEHVVIYVGNGKIVLGQQSGHAEAFLELENNGS